MEAQPLLLSLCSGRHLAGLLPYGASLVGTGQTGCHRLCFGLLCYVPFIYNQFRFLVFYRWPNKRLHRKIASLEAQMNRQSASWRPDMTRPEPRPLKLILSRALSHSRVFSASMRDPDWSTLVG
jgi:hypothetical protein